MIDPEKLTDMVEEQFVFEAEWGDPMFNDDQNDWVKYLSTLPREAKCDCGWDRRGECFGTCFGHPEKGGYPGEEG